MRDVLAKMRECGKYVKMRDFPHDCGMVDTYGIYGERYNTSPTIINATGTRTFILSWKDAKINLFKIANYGCGQSRDVMAGANGRNPPG